MDWIRLIMRIDRKLHFKTKAKFLEEVGGNFTTPSFGEESLGTAQYGNLYGTDLVFIKDTGEIWTHGAFYGAMEAIDMIAALDLETEDDYKNCIDLSYVDINGNSLETQSTANCYVVHQRGLYKFPLIYGNAIKNGEDNQSAYVANIPEIPEGEGEGDGEETPVTESEFINYMGVKITSPYIEEDLADMNEKLTVENAFLIWSDESNVISDVELIDGEGCRYIQFKLRNVPKNGANAIIGIRGKDEDIIWSWHIWIFPEELADIETNWTGSNYKALTQNLGTKILGNKEELVCCTYQWGRKDPFTLRAFSNRSMEPVLYNENGNCIENRFNTRDIEEYFHLIVYPDIMNTGSNYAWRSYMQKRSNYWSNNKTIYDPCPIGYKVPPIEFYESFYDSEEEKWRTLSSQSGTKLKTSPDDEVGLFFVTAENYGTTFEDSFMIKNFRFDHDWNTYLYIRPIKEN